jgi:hypothetical protein
MQEVGESSFSSPYLTSELSLRHDAEKLITVASYEATKHLAESKELILKGLLCSISVCVKCIIVSKFVATAVDL